MVELDRFALTLAGICFTYSCISITVTEAVKWLESYYMSGDFDYPLIITWSCFVCMYFLILLYRKVLLPNSTKTQKVFGPPQYLTRSLWIRLVIPLGFFVGIHYACDNLSLTYLSVSAYTILSSSNTMWVMFFSMVLGLEEAEKSTVAIIALTVVGVVMTSTSNESSLTAAGVIFALVGAMCVGGRWPIAQVLLQVAKMDPFSLMFYYLPVCIGLLGTTILFTDEMDIFNQTALTSGEMIFAFVLIGIFSVGILVAYYLELHICSLTSAVTYQVLGIVKTTAQVFVSIWLYGEATTMYEWLGFACIVSGLVLYSYRSFVRIRAAGSLEAYNTEYKSRMTARLKRIGLFEGVHFTKAEEDADNAGKPLLS
mmetsp:Transcript_35784/g.95992  ORF Transcript_35784/g.95992 Transcript_35784/m.95992 type:complete len:369 (+) Transcript_35784:133-1239(+)